MGDRDIDVSKVVELVKDGVKSTVAHAPEAIGACGGAVSGGTSGAVAGAVVGLVGGPPGAAIGFVVGWTVGTLGGAFGGLKLARWLKSKMK